MTEVEASKADTRSPQVLPLSVKAYRALGEMGLIPEQTELLYGQVFRKISKSPLHSFLALRLLRLLQAFIPPGYLCRPEQPITCRSEEASKADTRSPQVLPLSVKAYRALGEMGLIPEQTELLYGQVFRKISKSPLHSFLALRLLRLLQAFIPPGYLCRPEQPITC